MDEEEYIKQRLREAEEQSMAFERCRHLPIYPRKIVFTTIESTTGFTCNPKYIALELLRRHGEYELVWLVNDVTKAFPEGIRKVENTLENRAYELSTAKIWIDNSRKQLEVRKRLGFLNLFKHFFIDDAGPCKNVHAPHIKLFVSFPYIAFMRNCENDLRAFI